MRALGTIGSTLPLVAALFLAASTAMSGCDRAGAGDKPGAGDKAGDKAGHGTGHKASASKGKTKGGGRGRPRIKEATAVEALTVGRSPVVMVGDYSGEVRAERATVISADVAGRVVAMDVRLGDWVDEGAELARIDDLPARQQVRAETANQRRAQARVRAGRVQRDNLNAELQRNKPLARQGMITARELESLTARAAAAREEAAVTEAELASADARLATAEETRARTHVLAPFAGRVAARHSEVGSWAQPGLPLLDLVRDCDLHVRVTVPEHEAPLLRPQMPATIRLSALPAQPLVGRVLRLAPAIDPASRTLRVDIALPGTACAGPQPTKERSVLRPGMVAHARIVLGSAEDALVVPEPAVGLARDGSRYVWRVVDGKAERRPVAIGLHGDGLMQVRQGLHAGDQVVLRGHEKLRPGVGVQLVGGVAPEVVAPAAVTRSGRE